MFRPLWIEINLGVLRKNFKLIKNYVGKRVGIIATVKQSAYGHGLVAVAQELKTCAVDFFGVGSLEEAITLREAGIRQPIIVLSAVLSKFADYFVRYSIRPLIVDLNFAKALNCAAQKQKVKIPTHVKIDTGMGRLGLYYKEAQPFIIHLAKLKNIVLEGICTHFPTADVDFEFTNYQISVFNQLIAQLAKSKIFFKYQHCANSIAILNYPHSHFNMVRPGLILYGIKPSANIKLAVEPALRLKSKIIFLKKVRKGMGISYGRTYIAKKPTIIATVAIGYADGYPWSLSQKARVIIKRSFFNLAGRVCMDHIMIDLGQRRDIKVGEEVILIGGKGECRISAEDLAQCANTIAYEIVSRLSPNIPRIYSPSPKAKGELRRNEPLASSPKKPCHLWQGGS